MSSSYDYLRGAYHLTIRIKPHNLTPLETAERVAVFHSILAQVDADWPWRTYRSNFIQVCEHCLGVLVNNPRVGPQDIKAAAAQVGLGVKIYRFVLSEKCRDKHGVNKYKYLDKDTTRMLYKYKPEHLMIEGFQIKLKDPTKARGRIIVFPPTADDDTDDAADASVLLETVPAVPASAIVTACGIPVTTTASGRSVRETIFRCRYCGCTDHHYSVCPSFALTLRRNRETVQ